jgi:peroxiredoxin Q/BCP
MWLARIGVGDRAPDFSLYSSAGEKVTLSEFFGKKRVVIFFYPMDESPVCSREAEAFRNKYKVFQELEAEIIGISSQSVKSHKSFSIHHKLLYNLLSDPHNDVRRLYGVSSTLGIVPRRATFVIDKKGIVKHVFSSQLQPAKHAEQALSALKREIIPENKGSTKTQ